MRLHHKHRGRALYKACVALLFFLAPTLTSHAGNIHLITFNVQNLFDGTQNGQEYAQYLPPRWNARSYETRLVAIGTALQSLEYPLDVIVLQEIENRAVVEDLRKYYLPAFKHIATSDNKHGAVELAIMSKHPIVSTKTHALRQRKPNKQFRTLRPLLDVSIATSPPPHKSLQIIAVHLKSHRKSRGTLSSDEIRAHQFKLIVKSN